jgi:hypothetical protein
LFILDSVLQNAKVANIFVLLYRLIYINFDKHGLGYILGEFSVNLSGHPGGDPPFSLSIQRNAISDRTTGIIAIKSGTLSFEKNKKISYCHFLYCKRTQICERRNISDQ